VPRKPQYQMAPEEPLLLHACAFEGLALRRSPRLIASNIAAAQEMLDGQLVGAALRAAVLDRLTGDAAAAAAEGGQGAALPRVPRRATGGSSHMPLLRRACEPSVEERLKRFGIDLAALEAAAAAANAGGGAAAMQE